MKAVIFGAGNIGRGFIGAIFSEGGYDVTFIDVSKPVIEKINTDNSYPLKIVSGDTSRTVIIKNISAIDGNDIEAASAAIADCDIAVTCVGAGAIKYIVPTFAAGVKKRCEKSNSPIDLLICENLMDADKYIHSLLENLLTENELSLVGLVETSVGRMVPVLRPEDKAENILSVAVEEYNILPVDKNAFKGTVPSIKNIVPFSPFHYYIERKLYIHNAGHAVCAYLGDYTGHEYIYSSINDPCIRLFTQNAMLESAAALSTHYSSPIQPVLDHVSDLIRRFGNKALGDTCARVGGDIPRKLSVTDRLIGGAQSVLAAGGLPVFLAAGAAAALYKYIKENSIKDSPADVLKTLSTLDKEKKTASLILKFYPMFERGDSLGEILKAADEIKYSDKGMII